MLRVNNGMQGHLPANQRQPQRSRHRETARDVSRWLVAIGAGVVLGLGLMSLLGVLLRPDPHALQAVKDKAKQTARAQQRKGVVKTRLAAKAAPRPLAEPPKPEVKPPQDDLNGQVVETARPEREEAPDRAKYLGRYDMKVEREQKSQGKKTMGRDMGRLAIANPSPLQSPNSKSKDPSQLPQAAARPAPQQGEQAATGAESPKTVADGKGAGQPAEANRGVPRSPVLRGAPTGLLLPATSAANIAHNLQALSGSPGSIDALPDVEDEGDVNLLNTRKFRYWDFFDRVKNRVANEWDPGSIWRDRDPDGQKYGAKSRLTVLKVTLDGEGALKQLRVAKQSGLEFLDDEAKRAMTAASPFSNPPVGMRNASGEIEFQFGFLFEISSQRFRMRGWQ